MKTIKKAKIAELLDKIAAEQTIFAPVAVEGVTRFARWGQHKGDLYLEGNSLLPPKDLLFPQTEKMYSYHVKGMTAAVDEVATTAEPQIIFGIRPCDVKSLEMLDDVFLTKGYVDEFYKSRRDNTLLVALGCRKPEPTCFCTSWGIDPAQAPGADVNAFDLGEELGFEARTEAGQKFLDAYTQFFSEASSSAPKAEECTLKVDPEGITEKLQKMFEYSLWDELYHKCLGCGICTYVCPTCHCFDIQSENRGDQGFKFRCWDSCMFSEYTRMAGGHNPRPSKKERLRNRFLHKLQYFPERYNKFACVGCGRCLSKCPVNMDITRLIDRVKEVKLDE
ncbi:4Fe-4S dicluster domain-containing protein [Calderihabitans maritimus]|uniref:4Fe-4S ferredoxin n=1 Tax=Calderihabitans maritimus TaxID=1246530 RepID=A0A1Z5HUB4_9FIRM|nr:4Fe-4S dicluster domain-containing protein [Calderihabitans maritimus]GAW92998.1 4Fe-4S ferredoxin [Calderihabitans maritimus]